MATGSSGVQTDSETPPDEREKNKVVILVGEKSSQMFIDVIHRLLMTYRRWVWLVSKSEGVNESVYGSSAATAHKYHCISLRGIHCITYDQPGRRVYYIVVSPNTIKFPTIEPNRDY